VEEGQDAVRLPQRDRARLEALRYATNEESAAYLAIMRTFTGAMSGLLSDQSAAEVRRRLAEQGLELEVDTVDARLSYLVERGNLARSPRETEARSLKDYLTNRARYQLTQIGELVQRQVEELLQHTETAHEVSSEMLGGILAGLHALLALDDERLRTTEPDDVARQVATVFAQFETLVESTREFYTYLSQVLVRYDLDRAEFQLFKTALLDYLQRFVDEIARLVPQVAHALVRLEPRVAALTARANDGQRLLALDGSAARRSRGLDPADWSSLHAWFVGGAGRDSDAAGVRRLATDAMRALLVNLRRIAASSERDRSRYSDLLRLARWFDESDDDTAHAVWVAAFGLYSCRHLSFPADDDADPVPATASWWRTPVAEVPVTLREAGERKVAGRSGRKVDYSQAKAAAVASREAAERRRRRALDEISSQPGPRPHRRLSDDARAVLLELYARTLTTHGRALRDGETARLDTRDDGLVLAVRRTPGSATVLQSPAGRLELADLTVDVQCVQSLARAEVTA
jgi:uncharacterized protein (TIGR02677 family)